MKIFIPLFVFLSSLSLYASEIDTQKKHVLYLMQSEKITEAIDLYGKTYKQTSVHDHEVLEGMAHILLQQAAGSIDEDEQLLSIYAMGISGISSLVHLYESGISSKNPLVQASTIQVLTQMQEDFVDTLLHDAMHSKFLMIRMEAASCLAFKKHSTAVGQIESLMYRLPKPFWVYFPDMFATIGSVEAMGILSKMMTDVDLPIRIAATLSAAKYGRDDQLPFIRALVTHNNLAEQEAAATALGYLKDLKSTEKLAKLTKSSDSSVKLAAARSLYMMGHTEYKDPIQTLAKEENLFAIHLLETIPESNDLLASLLSSSNQLVRINAALSLLKLRDDRCLPHILGIILHNETDLAFLPYHSVGSSLMYWKVYGSSTQLSKFTKSDFQAMSLSFRERILIDALELSPSAFLHLARRIFNAKQLSLVPTLVTLLENLPPEQATQFLQSYSQKTGAPFIRAYANLGLFRLGKNPEAFYEWIRREKGKQVIQFRPTEPWSSRQSKPNEFLLTPEETSRLLIESYSTLATRHDPVSIDLLLEAIKEGNPKNRALLAGILLKTIQ